MSDDARVNSDFIAALDVGTTNIKCLVINSSGHTIGKAVQKVQLHQPQPGWMEINPDELYTSIVEVIHLAIQDANITVDKVKSLGISTQRATFVTWKKDTGQYLHNFITWQDTRTEKLVKDVNSSWRISFFRQLCYLIYKVSRMDKFKLTSNFNISSTHVSSRLLWVLSNIGKVQECLKNNNLMFGTLDTWLLYKLTNGRLHVTDVTNASTTGFFDLFNMSWGLLPLILNIPIHILPKVVDNDYSFGATSEEIFGFPINIGCLMGDQMASMFGSGCYSENVLKITIGTGAFIHINTLEEAYPCLRNMYPIIGWKISNNWNYLLEIPCINCGPLINWLQQIGLITDPSECSEMALKVKNSNGIYFIPNPERELLETNTAFIGLNSSTTKEHKVRAVLESIVYKLLLGYRLLLTERKENYSVVRVDGGLAKNDFICQLLADLSNLTVERMASTEMSSMGVTYIAGLTSRIWKDKEEIISLQAVERIFHPTDDKERKEQLINDLENWLKVVNT